MQTMPGLVSLYDEMAACHVANHQYFGDWQTLEKEEKALLVAHYFLTNLVHGHQEDASADEIAKRNKKASRKGR